MTTHTTGFAARVGAGVSNFPAGSVWLKLVGTGVGAAAHLPKK